jgi:hypothetical protein
MTSTPREWVREYLEARLEDAFELEVTTPLGVEPEAVCILDTERFELHAPVEDVPEWIDAERDLPVEAPEP